MTKEVHIPIGDYYKEGVIDYWTITNVSGWWTALVLHADPKTERKVLSLYRWRRRDGQWKTMGCVRIKNKKALSTLLSVLQEVDLDE